VPFYNAFAAPVKEQLAHANIAENTFSFKNYHVFPP